MNDWEDSRVACVCGGFGGVEGTKRERNLGKGLVVGGWGSVQAGSS